MARTQQVTEFDAAAWRNELGLALRNFILKTAANGIDFAPEIMRIRELFNVVPQAERAKPGTHEVMNRLASLAQADPKLFDATRTVHALKMQDVAISRCSAIMQIMHNGDKQ